MFEDIKHGVDINKDVWNLSSDVSVSHLHNIPKPRIDIFEFSYLSSCITWLKFHVIINTVCIIVSNAKSEFEFTSKILKIYELQTSSFS